VFFYSGEQRGNRKLSDLSLPRPTLSAFPRLVLAAIIAVYLALGALYAYYTPPWQVPDEPAHYNYIRHLVENQNFPILQMGDYPHDYLERLKAERFPPDLSIEPIRYEAHQPPLYYLLAVPVYVIFGGALLPLRLLSLLFGGALIFVAYRIVGELFPDDDVLALGTSAFVAFVPMHIAMTAGVGNDALAELLLSLSLWLMLRRLRDEIEPRRYATYNGLVVGLALLTKTTIYIVVPLLLFVEVGRWMLRRSEIRRLLAVGQIAAQEGKASARSRRGKGKKKATLAESPGWVVTVRPGEVARTLGRLAGISALLGGWWFVRNAVVYGDLDFFGWKRHDAIVLGQPRTGDLDVAAVRHFLVVTFKSFWAQFGWMGVLVDERIYLVLFSLCALALIGLLLFALRLLWERDGVAYYRRWALALLGTTILLVLGGDVWYNLKFIQAQGRYLFPAIVPLGLFFVLGLRELLAERYQSLLLSLVFLGLAALDVVCLFRFIVPALS
jgi:hypothetical protein